MKISLGFVLIFLAGMQGRSYGAGGWKRGWGERSSFSAFTFLFKLLRQIRAKLKKIIATFVKVQNIC